MPLLWPSRPLLRKTSKTATFVEISDTHEESLQLSTEIYRFTRFRENGLLGRLLVNNVKWIRGGAGRQECQPTAIDFCSQRPRAAAAAE